ncbi:MAG: hypothetical protein RL268_3007, partial [Pseudomonadota bacterium]
MKTGFISKLGSLVLASALWAPLGTAQANTTLESEFDRA